MGHLPRIRCDDFTARNALFRKRVGPLWLKIAERLSKTVAELLARSWREIQNAIACGADWIAIGRVELTVVISVYYLDDVARAFYGHLSRANFARHRDPAINGG